MLTLDTSGLVALIDAADRYHAGCEQAFDDDGGPYFVPVAILSEVSWFLEQRYAPHVLVAFLDDLAAGSYLVDWDAADIDRIRELVVKYQDLELGLADAAVIACVERHRGRVLTTDHRDFDVVARGERTIEVLPTDG